ncbi:MAG TPA: hypothetical protein VK465_04830, partial [Fibrobacteria bacterium]|nr:hypothetical protein [Fibrobacteria bacterium]
MAATKEIWIQPGDTPALYSGEASKLILRGEPKIHFLRGSGYHSPYSEGDEDERGEFSSPVVSPIPKKTVSHWKKLGRSPESSALLRISVDPDILPPGEKLKLKAGSKTVELEVDETAEGVVTKDMLLFVHGDGGAETLEGIKIIDVSKGGNMPFEATVEVTAGREKRELGMADLLIQDPADGKFQSARYGLFKTRTPSVKLVCPEVGANNLRVLLDDGNEDTPDELDITKLLDPAGDVTDADLPQAVAQNGTLVDGEWEPLALRGRIYTEPPEDGKDLGVLLLGENRLRIHDTYSGELVYLAHFLLYEADDDSIVGSWYGDEPMDRDGVEVKVAADHVLLDFKEGTKNPDMAALMHALHMVPQGFSPDFRIVQASPMEHAPAATLKSLVERAVTARLEGLESGGMDYVDAEGALESVALERYPEAFRADFNAGNSGFNNGVGNFFHHFYIHTFPAHRLIDHVRFGNSSPPLITLEGSHFLNKTFLVPAVKATIDALMQARNDNPARKLA